MLVNLCDYKQSVTLIANSGVQFLDFGLTPQDTASNGRFFMCRDGAIDWQLVLNRQGRLRRSSTQENREQDHRCAG